MFEKEKNRYLIMFGFCMKMGKMFSKKGGKFCCFLFVWKWDFCGDGVRLRMENVRIWGVIYLFKSFLMYCNFYVLILWFESFFCLENLNLFYDWWEHVGDCKNGGNNLEIMEFIRRGVFLEGRMSFMIFSIFFIFFIFPENSNKIIKLWNTTHTKTLHQPCSHKLNLFTIQTN
jgi:hypothetical protein